MGVGKEGEGVKVGVEKGEGVKVGVKGEGVNVGVKDGEGMGFIVGVDFRDRVGRESVGVVCERGGEAFIPRGEAEPSLFQKRISINVTPMPNPKRPATNAIRMVLFFMLRLLFLFGANPPIGGNSKVFCQS